MKKIVTSMCLLMLVVTANAQITLNESTIQSLMGKVIISVDHEPSDTTGAMALFNQSGANQTWDITGYGWVATDTASLEFRATRAGTPGENDPDFASANLTQVATFSDDSLEAEGATYSSFDSNGLYQLGSVFVFDVDGDMVDDTLKSLYTPAELDIPFPFTYMTTVSDSVTHSQFVADTLVSMDATAKDGQVDGWGTLITPDGSFDVLRYAYEERIYFGGFVFVDNTVEWWGATGPIFQMNLSDGFGFPTLDMYYARQTVTDPTSIDPIDGELPRNFALQQNYPNPFNPSKVVPFELDQASHVNLVVYDMLGRQIATLVDGSLPAGSHSVTWNPEDLPGGIYIARIDVDGQKQSRTMTFIK